MFFALSFPSFLSTGWGKTKSNESKQNLISFHDAALLLQIINTSQSQSTAGNGELGQICRENE